jgi:Fur family peroxide stress response transcriptional regulator
MEKEKQRYSKQREAILKLLKNTKLHPTAEWVYSEVKKEIPDISLGTVYRNLNLLVKQKEIDRFKSGNAHDRFDGITDGHSHLICEKCGEIFDAFIPEIDKLWDVLNNKNGFELNKERVNLYGICKKCK